MSKELTPLEALEEIRECLFWSDEGESKLNIIETALKDYEKKTKLAKEYADVDNVAKRLKTLEIIKEKTVDIAMILSCESAEDYNRWCDTGASWSNEYVTQEEFDLLKEVLK